MSTSNLALRLLLELAALVALGIWGCHMSSTALPEVVLAISAPLAAAILWGTFVSPKARVRVPAAVRLCIELLIFTAAISGLAGSGSPKLALALAIVLAIHEGWRAAELHRCAH